MILLAITSAAIVFAISFSIVRFLQKITHPFNFENGIRDFVLQIAATMLVLKFGADAEKSLDEMFLPQE